MKQPTYPQACISCKAWAGEPQDAKFQPSVSWQWCNEFPASWSHADYLCDSYDRLNVAAVRERLAAITAAAEEAAA